MVHDPRVTTALSRLGGIYRDPTRVDRDASSLLKSSVGDHLTPITAVMVENTGASAPVLVLQGTIAIHFRGNTYQLLCDIYLPAGYPRSPPVCFVRLAENMYLKENHRHVGADGKVYLPYLHEWSSLTHNLVELVVAMSSVFSADPPVFTRAAAATAAQTTATTTTQQQQQQPPPPAYRPPAGNNNNGGTVVQPNPAAAAAAGASQTSSWQQQAEEMLAAEAAEANAAAAAARAAAQEEEQQRAALQAQRAWEQAKTRQVKEQVTAKVQGYLKQTQAQVQSMIQNDWRDSQRLKLTAEQKIDLQIEQLKEKKEKYQRLLERTEEKRQDVETWLEEAASNTGDRNNETVAALSVDDTVKPATVVHAQMLDLSAENQAIADALYFLDRALQRGKLDCEEHLKQVRKLAKKQFLVRAHLIKIHQVLLQQQQS